MGPEAEAEVKAEAEAEVEAEAEATSIISIISNVKNVLPNSKFQDGDSDIDAPRSLRSSPSTTINTTVKPPP